MPAIARRDFGFRLNVYADTLLSDGEQRQRVTTRETAELLVDLGVRVLAPGIVQAPTPRGARLTSWRSVSNQAIGFGAVRLDLMDSTSSLAPEAMKHFVRRFRSRLANLVAEETGLRLPPLKPLVGQYAFLRHMPSDVLACLQRGTDAFPPVSACVDPRVIGSQMTWVWPVSVPTRWSAPWQPRWARR